MIRPFPHKHEGSGPRCLACNEPRWMHPDGLSESNPSKRPATKTMGWSPEIHAADLAVSRGLGIDNEMPTTGAGGMQAPAGEDAP
jgi:hypothetical protein